VRSADDDASDDTSQLHEGDISNFNCLGAVREGNADEACMRVTRIHTAHWLDWKEVLRHLTKSLAPPTNGERCTTTSVSGPQLVVIVVVLTRCDGPMQFSPSWGRRRRQEFSDLAGVLKCFFACSPELPAVSIISST
jgi:hypothetical protein